VTFAPNAPSRTGAFNPIRVALFWLMMVGLAVILWQVDSRPNSEKAAAGMAYSDFMNQVDRNNVASVKLYTSQSTAEVYGRLRQPVQDFKVTIPKETIPDLTERLRKDGVTIEVSSSPDSDWRSAALRALPFVVLFVVWILRFARMRTKWNQSRPNDPPSEPSSRPLG
jgi:ATP-dependent Zn protease